MAVRIELKRSAIPGKVPTIDQLDLGELAINTYDGAIYFKQDTGVSQSIIQVTTTGGTTISASYSVTSSYAVTASYALNVPDTASFAVSASYAATASAATDFVVSNDLTASNALITGTITAQTLVVQTVTSSVVYSSGSNIFGNDLSNTQEFTGSVTVTGSLGVNGPMDVIGDSTTQGNQFNEGTYWRAVSGSNFPSLPWRAITYGNGLFVAAAQRSAAPVSTTGSIATSPDGVNWTFRTLPSLTSLINITYQNGIFIAIGHLNQRSFYSYDGINWFNGVNFTGQGYGITYGRDKFVACKIDNPGFRINISYDGINWQGVATPASMDLAFTGVAYGNGIYVAVAGSTNADAIAISYDGITWTSVTRPLAGTVSPASVMYGKGLFVVTCDNGKILTSPDGINWTARDTPLTGLIWKCIYAEGLFIAAGAFTPVQNKFIYSVDGITWEEAITPALNNWAGFAYGNGMLIAISYTGPDTSALVAKSGELNSFIPQNDNITHGKQLYSSDVALVQNARLGIGTNAPLGSLVVASGNTLLGQNVDTGQRLQVSGDTILIGAGGSGATFPLVVQNSGGLNLFRLRNDGEAFLSTGNTITGGTYSSQRTFATSAGIGRSFYSLCTFGPVTGNAEYNSVHLQLTLAQGGTATGISRGLFVDTTGSAVDFRAIETTNGKVIFANLPTSSAGLPAGALWNNGGVVNIV